MNSDHLTAQTDRVRDLIRLDALVDETERSTANYISQAVTDIADSIRISIGVDAVDGISYGLDYNQILHSSDSDNRRSRGSFDLDGLKEIPWHVEVKHDGGSHNNHDKDNDNLQQYESEIKERVDYISAVRSLRDGIVFNEMHAMRLFDSDWGDKYSTAEELRGLYDKYAKLVVSAEAEKINQWDLSTLYMYVRRRKPMKTEIFRHFETLFSEVLKTDLVSEDRLQEIQKAFEEFKKVTE